MSTADAPPPPLPPSTPASPPPAGPGAGAVPSWWRAAAVALAVALVAALSFAFTRGGDAGTATPLDTSSDQARAACTLLARVPDAFDIRTEWDEQSQRLGAAEMLAGLAAQRDGRYASLLDALRRPRNVANQQFSADSAEFTAAMNTAREACRGV